MLFCSFSCSFLSLLICVSQGIGMRATIIFSGIDDVFFKIERFVKMTSGLSALIDIAAYRQCPLDQLT